MLAKPKPNPPPPRVPLSQIRAAMLLLEAIFKPPQPSPPATRRP